MIHDADDITCGEQDTPMAYTAAWTDEATSTWDLIIAEDGHFAGMPDSHVVAEYHSSAPVSEDFPGDDYLRERGWIVPAGAQWEGSANAFYSRVVPIGIVECRICGRRSDDGGAVMSGLDDYWEGEG